MKLPRKMPKVLLSLLVAMACLAGRAPRPVRAEMAAPEPPGSAAMMRVAPQPPTDNPHPPGTPEDIRRVNFAVTAIKTSYGDEVLEIRHPHIIPWSWQNFIRHGQRPTPNSGVIVEATLVEKPLGHPSTPVMGPALHEDEYMVHVYTRFKQDPRWHHLDVILTEDAQGQPSLRRFYTIPIPDQGGHLPDGVVC